MAVTQIKESEAETVTQSLAGHFISYYEAPNLEAAKDVTQKEVVHITDLCGDHDPNILLTISLA